MVGLYADRVVEKTKTAPTKVWIDYENGGHPKDLAAEDYYDSIVRGLRSRGFTGEVTVTIFVGYLNSIGEDVESVLMKKMVVNHAKQTISKYISSVLFDNMIDFYSIVVLIFFIFSGPEGSAGNQAADDEMTAAMEKWLKKGLPPQNTMIITADNGFKHVFGKLRQAGHSTLLALVKDDKVAVNSGSLQVIALLTWPLREFMLLGPAPPKEEKRKRERGGRSRRNRNANKRGRGR